jgi:predicted AAA+ superfamily ATPase
MQEFQWAGDCVMYRKAIESLKVWKQKPNRKPLVIRGARQTGKTWLMRQFANECFENYIEVSFDSNERVNRVFAPDLDPKRIVSELADMYQQKVSAENTLIIFDEVQESPLALRALKYFCEKAPEYHIVCAGSYFGISLHKNSSFPVGKVDILYLYPLNFGEFLIALGEERLQKYIVSGEFDKFRLYREDYLKLLKKYLFIGGMPEVVQNYRDNKSYAAVQEVQSSLLTMYDLDFSKHTPSIHLPRVRALWRSIPQQLSKENKKFKYGDIAKSARAREFEVAMMWLEDMGAIYKVNRATAIKHPLKSYVDEKAFKLFSLDVGLVACMSNLDWDVLNDKEDVFLEFRGALTEQYVLCELIANANIKPMYWGNDTGKAEVDFIFQHKGEVVPLEVKSGSQVSSRSLKVYIDKFHPDVAVRTSPSDYRQDILVKSDTASTKMIELPLYAISALPHLW